MRTTRLVLPAIWKDALLHDDTTGLTDHERELFERWRDWASWNGVRACIDVLTVAAFETDRHDFMPQGQKLLCRRYLFSMIPRDAVMDDDDIRISGEPYDLPDPREQAPGSGGLAAAVIAAIVIAACLLLYWSQDPKCRTPGAEMPAHCAD